MLQTKDQLHNAKIDALSDEVGDFHPLLDSLFRRLPNVRDVEYRHGPQERGTDFIINSEDPVLMSDDFIGVVVKTGDIVSKDVSAIVTQLREAREEKIFGSGKRRIKCNKFWVVTNGKIQDNAQHLIESEFSGMSIDFVPKHKVRILIDRYYKEFWEAIPHQIAAKLNQIHEQIVGLDSQMTLIADLDVDFYINQRILQRENKRIVVEKWKKQPKEVDLIQCVDKGGFYLIEGDAGFGKSKLLRQTVIRLATAESFQQINVVPMYLSFWDFVDNYDGSFDQVFSQADKMKDLFSPMNMRHTLFLDGFDETNRPPEEQIEWLERIIYNAREFGDVSLFVSSRSLSQTTRIEFVKFGFVTLELQPLSLNQVVQFIDKVCKAVQRRTNLIEDLKASPLYQDLPRSPISAILLAQLLSQNEQELPSNLPELYSKYTELMLGRWDIRKGLQDEREYRAIKNIIGRLARFTIDNNIPELCEDEARGFFVDYVAERNGEVDADDLFKKVTSRTGVLSRNPFSGNISFRHRSFGEYFYAAQAVGRAEELPVSQNVLNIYWQNIHYFYFGLRQDCPALVDQLLQIKPNNELERWMAVVNYSSYLLAASETPYKHVVPIVKEMLKETVGLYRDITEGRLDSPLNRLTRMQILSVVTRLFQVKYGYRFFQGALEDAATSLDTIFEGKQDQAIALFFLGFARAGFDDPKLLDFVLKNQSDYLPVEMKMILSYEAETRKCRSTLVRKFQRKVTKEVGSGMERKNLIRLITETPIRISAK